MIDHLHIVWQPVGPPTLIVGAAVAAVALVVVLTVRRSATHRAWRILVAGLRVAAIAGVAAALLLAVRQPVSAQADDQTQPTLHVLMDTSASMAQADAAAAATRLDSVKNAWLDDAALQRLQEVAGVRWHAFDTQLRRVGGPRGVAADGAATNLHRSLSDLLGQAAGAALILSDGAATDVDDPRVLADLGRRAAARGMTLFAATAGSTDAPANVRLAAYATPAGVFEGEPVELTAIVQRRDTAAAMPIKVTIRADGAVVAELSTILPAGRRHARLATELVPRPGEPRQVHYELNVEPHDGEADTADNTTHVMVDYLGRRIRVLLLEGQPAWDTRFMVDALSADRRMDLTVVQAMSEGLRRVAREGVGRGEPTTPLASLLTEQGLSRFDVVILGRRVQRLMPGDGAAELRRFVTERGGGLFLARGRPFDGDPVAAGHIAPLAPIDWGERFVEPLVLQFDAAAERLMLRRGMPADAQVAWDLPRMTGATRVVGEKAGAVVHMRQAPSGGRPDAAPQQAALVSHRVGAGRVVALLTEGLWRWAMLPPRLDAYRAVYRTLISSAVRYAAGDEQLLGDADVAVRATPVNATVGQPVTLVIQSRYRTAASLLDARGTLSVTREGDRAQAFTPTADPSDPTRATVAFTPRSPGDYRVTYTSPDGDKVEARFRAAATADEAQHAVARPDLLRTLVSASGGRLLEAGDIEPLLEALRGREINPTTRRDGGERRGPWVLAIAVAVGLLSIEWFVRRGVGWR